MDPCTEPSKLVLEQSTVSGCWPKTPKMNFGSHNDCHINLSVKLLCICSCGMDAHVTVSDFGEETILEKYYFLLLLPALFPVDLIKSALSVF